MNHMTISYASNLMNQRFAKGEAEEKALVAIVEKTVIRDKLVHPKAMEFVPGTGEKDKTLRLQYRAAEGSLTLHRHALNQLCSKVSLPMSYVGMLQGGEEWKLWLLAHNLNELYGKPEWRDRNGEPSRFLHRIVGNELRGFLSRRYNRNLASAPLLRAFTEACRKEGAKPVESHASDVRVSLKCMYPNVFQAFEGEFVCVGTEWANSDFGSGKLAVSQSVWRLSNNTSAVLDDTLSKVHLGSIIEDSDLEMSEETAHKEMVAISSAIDDTVKAHLSEMSIERLLSAIRAAHEKEIPWHKLRNQLGKFLNKKDVEWLQQALDAADLGVIDLPPISTNQHNERVPNAWWASNAIGVLAAKETDDDRRMELQREAGKLLSGLIDQKEV